MQSDFSSNGTNSFATRFVTSPLSLFSNHSLNNSGTLPQASEQLANPSSINNPIRLLNVSVAILIPNPNSALSSNNEFAQAGPCPSLFVVYGVAG